MRAHVAARLRVTLMLRRHAALILMPLPTRAGFLMTRHAVLISRHLRRAMIARLEACLLMLTPRFMSPRRADASAFCALLLFDADAFCCCAPLLFAAFYARDAARSCVL